MKKYVTPSGEEHGLINELPNSVQSRKEVNASHKEEYEKKKKDDHRTVKVRYLHEKGGTEGLERAYMNYAGDTIQMWRFIHDHEYEVPKGLVDDVNDKDKLIPKRSEVCDANGTPTKVEGKGRRVHQFVGII